MEDEQTNDDGGKAKHNDARTSDLCITAAPAISGEGMPLSKDWCEVKVSRRHHMPNGLTVDTSKVVELETDWAAQLQNNNTINNIPNHYDHDDEFDDDVDRPPERTRQRSPSGSCLKSPGKTPPGTPFEKKSVRFADDLGRQLVQRVFLTKAESGSDIHVPDYVYETLGIYPHETVPTTSTFMKPLFHQPSADYMGFQNRLRTTNVSLENAATSDLTIFGTVKVCNLSYHKSVKVRYSLNEWQTYADKKATYVTDSCDGPTDRFSFALTAPTNMEIGSRLECAVCFQVGGREFWDNNDGENYKFECQPKDD